MGSITYITVNGSPRFMANFQEKTDGSVTSQLKESFGEAEQAMNRQGYYRFPLECIPGDITTREELYRITSALSNAGFFFEIRNYFSCSGVRGCRYMIKILSHKSE